MKKLPENPIGWLFGWFVVATVALVLISSFWKVISDVGALFIVALAIVMLGSIVFKIIGKRSNGGNYCQNCPHPNHGRQTCGQCRCVRS